MASANDCSFESFKLPPEPSPLTSVVDEQDSFVILWEDGHIIQEVNKKHINSNDSKDTDKTAIENQSDMEQGVFIVNSDSSLINSLTSEEYQEKVLQVIEENSILKERIRQNNDIMNMQHEKMLVLQEYQNQAQEGKIITEMLKKVNQNLIDELKVLKAENDAQYDEITALKRTLIEFNQSSKDDTKYLEISKVEIEKLKRENINLTNELEQMKIRNNSYDEEVTILKHSLTETTKNHEDNIKMLELAKKELEEIKTELMEIKSVNKERQKSQNKEIETLRSQLHEANFEEMEKIGTELNTVKVTLMQLEQSKAIADGQIEDLDKEIIDLRRKLQDSQQQGDELFALKTQLNVFRTDFEAEKQCKQRVENENDKLSEEVQNMRVCCQELHEEIIALRRTANRTVSVSTSSSSPFEEAMMCPICNFGFTSEQALENHVHRCLGIPSSGL